MTEERVLEWARAARGGDRESFSRLVERFAPSLLYFFAVRGSAPDRTEDLVQETLVRAYQSISSFDGRSSFSSWLYGIAKNVYLQGMRQQRRHEHERVLPGDAPIREDPLRGLVAAERREAIRRALTMLPDRMQLVLQLRFIEKRSCREIALVLGTTVSAVSPLIYRAKAALRDRVERAGEAI